MTLLDAARRIVPEPLQVPVKRYLYPIVPMRWRMGRKYWTLRAFLQDAQWWHRERIESWQLEKLKATIRYAYENVPGYNLLYRESGNHPDDLQTLDDLRSFPFTTKELIRDNLVDFIPRDTPRWHLRYVTTGGSTGVPFGFYQTPVNEWMETAFMHSGWEWVGWRLGDRSAVLRGASIGSVERFWEYNPARRQLLLSSYHLKDDTYTSYMDKIATFAPKHLQAYPSVAAVLADYVIEAGDSGRVRLDSILLGSENIYEWQTTNLSRAFPGVRVFGWYGHSEQVILAPMCEYSSCYHIWPFYGFTEILKEWDQPVEEGDTGELVGTSFWNYGTPFIRYRTMDLARKGASQCKECGREFQLLNEIEGRMQEYVVAEDGGYVTLTALVFAQHFHAFGVTKSMQLHQSVPGEVTVRIVPREDFAARDAHEIKTKMESAVDGRITVRVVLVDSISRTSGGKHRFLEQELDIGHQERQ